MWSGDANSCREYMDEMPTPKKKTAHVVWGNETNGITTWEVKCVIDPSEILECLVEDITDLTYQPIIGAWGHITDVGEDAGTFSDWVLRQYLDLGYAARGNCWPTYWCDEHNCEMGDTSYGGLAKYATIVAQNVLGWDDPECLLFNDCHGQEFSTMLKNVKGILKEVYGVTV